MNVTISWKSKLDLCEGGSFSTVIFNRDIQLSVLVLLVFYIMFVRVSLC